MRREIEDLVEAVGTGEYYFAEIFAREGEGFDEPIAYDLVRAMLQWREGIRADIKAAISLSRSARNEFLAAPLAQILDDVVADDQEALRFYDVPAGQTWLGPDYETRVGFMRRRAKIRFALKALIAKTWS